MFEYIVVGAGFAGSVIAERIASELNKKVLVIERRGHLGGNCYDFRDESGILVHKYGPHLFHTESKEVFDYLSNFTEWHIYNHRVLAFIDGNKVPIPFNFNSMDILFSQDLSKRIQHKLCTRYEYGTKVPILELMKNQDEDLRFLAQYVYRNVFLNYTIKQWGRKPEDIDQAVTARVPIFVGRDNRYFQDKYQAVPADGYSELFGRLLSHPNIKLLLNTDFREIFSVSLDDSRIYFLGQEYKGQVIYTGMLDELFDYRYGILPYRSLRFRAKKLNLDYYQEVATVNYPNNYDFTRITEFKHIHPADTTKTIIVYEYPEDYDTSKIPYYPMFTSEAKDQYYKYCELAKKFPNLIFVGRLAEYTYYDMDDVVKRALEVYEEKIG